MLFELCGHVAVVAYSGSDGVAAALGQPPDVVICDIGLPGMNGFAVARALRANPLTAAARLVAVTGYGALADQERARQAGFDRHITKPIQPDQLREVLSAR